MQDHDRLGVGNYILEASRIAFFLSGKSANRRFVKARRGNSMGLEAGGGMVRHTWQQGALNDTI